MKSSLVIFWRFSSMLHTCPIFHQESVSSYWWSVKQQPLEFRYLKRGNCVKKVQLILQMGTGTAWISLCMFSHKKAEVNKTGTWTHAGPLNRNWKLCTYIGTYLPKESTSFWSKPILENSNATLLTVIILLKATLFENRDKLITNLWKK